MKRNRSGAPPNPLRGRTVVLLLSMFFLVNTAFGLAIRFLTQTYLILVFCAVWAAFLVVMYLVVRGFKAPERLEISLLLFLGGGAVISSIIPFVTSLFVGILLVAIVSVVLAICVYVEGYFDRGGSW